MPKEDGKIKWYLRPISVVLLLFFVLGPFALPLLYKSPKFSKTSRIILTIVVIIYTSFLIFASLEIGRELYIRMEELRGYIRANLIFPLIDIGSVVWSFGLTKAAEDNNAENLLRIHDKKLSSLYTVNWQDHAQHSEVYGGRGQ